MATTYHGGGSQSPTSLSRPIERVFEDAQHTGEICLSGRKIREYPKLAAKYDLVDTISADLSKNRLSEVPKEVCEYASMEKLNCYYNVIKSIPEPLVQLQALTYLNLSRNQLTVIPPFISQLSTLEVLIASHNKLVSLPEEMSVLDKLMELDVSCNEISHLPPQIGDLKSLKSLNVRRNFLVELPLEISKLYLRKLDFSSNRISKIPTVFRKIETLEDIILDSNPLTLPPAHVCTKGKQHIMKYLTNEANREDKKRGILNEAEMKRFRKSLPPGQSVSSEEFRNLIESPESRWKRHTVLSSDSGYSTTDSVEKCSWSPQETNGDAEDTSNIALKAAAAVKEQRHGRDVDLQRRAVKTDRPMPVSTSPAHPAASSAYSNTGTAYCNIAPPQPAPNSSYSSPQSKPTSPYPPSPHTPQTPPTPQGPGPGVLGSNLEDEFTRELQRQKFEYERKKKLAEQIRLQQEEDDEREQRRHAAMRVQEEQRALLERQKQDTRLLEEQRAWEESKQREAEEARRAEETQRAEEMRRAEEQRIAEERRRAEDMRRQVEEARQHKVENNFYYYNNNFNNNIYPHSHPHATLPSVHEQYEMHNESMNSTSPQSPQYGMHYRKPGLSSNSFKEERRTNGSSQLYRRTVSDSNQRLPVGQEPARTPTYPTTNNLQNGPLEEAVNGSTNTSVSSNTSSPNTVYNVENSVPSQNVPVNDGTQGRQTQNPPGTQSAVGSVTRRPKTATSIQTTSKVATSTEKHGRATTAATPTRTGVPTARKNNVMQNEELRKSQQSLKSQGQSETAKVRSRMDDQRVKTIQKEATNSYMNRRSSGSTSSEDDKKRATPTRTTGYTGAARRTGTGMSSTSSASRTTTPTARSSAPSVRTTTSTSQAAPRRVPTAATSASAGGALKNKRAGAVMSNATVKMLEDYKDANPNFTIRRQQEQHREESEQLESLRNTISNRLKLKKALPDNLSEALCDGVLLCHLANQIRPRSVASVHVPSPAVPKLTPAKCRRNVENFLEACKKIGVPRDHVCSSSDILEEKGINRVAMTVAALVTIATNPKGSMV